MQIQKEKVCQRTGSNDNQNSSLVAEDVDMDEEEVEAEEDLGPESTAQIFMELEDDLDECPPQRTVAILVGMLMPSPMLTQTAMYPPQPVQLPLTQLPLVQLPLPSQPTPQMLALAMQLQQVLPPSTTPPAHPAKTRATATGQEGTGSTGAADQPEPMDLSRTAAQAVQVPSVQPASSIPCPASFNNMQMS